MLDDPPSATSQRERFGGTDGDGVNLVGEILRKFKTEQSSHHVDFPGKELNGGSTFLVASRFFDSTLFIAGNPHSGHSK